MPEPELVRYTLDAMATVFELALWGGTEAGMLAASHAVAEEIHRIDAQLSRFDPASDIADLNQRAAAEPVRVEPRLFQLLLTARRLSAETDGAFDPTVGSLMEAWGFHGHAVSDVDAAREGVGFGLVELDPAASTVRFARPGVSLDLGAIGKGYALDCAVDVLADCGVPNALIHGGTSTVCAVGSGPDGRPWPVAVRDPRTGGDAAVVRLRDSALSVSAQHGRTRRLGRRTVGHVMDPRTGWPAQSVDLAVVVCGSAAESDALSTAVLVGGAPLVAGIGDRKHFGAIVIEGSKVRMYGVLA